MLGMADTRKNRRNNDKKVDVERQSMEAAVIHGCSLTLRKRI
jgi:hypothetical protein